MTPSANTDKGGLDSSKYANPTEPTPQPTPTSHGNEQPEREAQLRAELEGLKRVNEVVEGVISSLDRAKAGMDSVNATTQNAHALLDTYTRILSRTEHNQRLILNPAWEGASADVADAENEVKELQRQRQRREQEEQRRREEQERRKEDEARRREEATKNADAPRGRGRGVRSRAGASSSRTTSAEASTAGGARGRGAPNDARTKALQYGRVRGRGAARGRGGAG